MKVLLVEDDLGKQESLREHLVGSQTGLDLREAVSLISALRLVRAETFDLIILDITLPYRDDDESSTNMHKLGGEEFLRQMIRHEIETPVVVVSQFDTFGDAPNIKTFSQLDSELQQSFSSIYRGGVYYHASSSDWVEEFDKIVRQFEGYRT